MKRKIRLTESNLKNIIKEAIKRTLQETRLDYDVDNFSGRHYKTPSDWIESYEYYLDDPEKKDSIEYDMYEDPYYDGFDSQEDGENDYSWNLFDRRGIYPGVGSGYNVGKDVVDKEIDDAIALHNAEKDWSPSELRNGQKNMERFVNGSRGTEGIEASWEDLHETQLRRIVKESVRSIINESMGWNKQMFIKDLRSYLELNRSYDGSAGMANARWRKLMEVMGDLPYGIGGHAFERWLVTNTSGTNIDATIEGAIEWVQNQLDRRPIPPRIY